MPFARTLAFRHFDVFRGGPDDEGAFVQFSVPVEEGMVVLDALHWIQANEAPTWRCAGTARRRSAAPAAPR